jgi:hypothetical protein
MSTNNVFQLEKDTKYQLTQEDSFRKINQAPYSRKSQFGMNTQEYQETHKKVALSSQSDVFSIAELEFQKVQILAKQKVKDQEIEEAQLENLTLNH